MNWTIFFLLMCCCFIASCLAAILYSRKQNASSLKPFNLLCIGIIVTAFIGVLPVNYNELSWTSNPLVAAIETVFMSLVNVMQIFTADMDGKELLGMIAEQDFPLKQAYILFMSLICTIAPFLTVSAIVSVFLSINAAGRYLCSYFQDAYIFSELNERSVALAENLRASHHNDIAIVFANVPDNEDEGWLDLSGRAKSIGAILFKTDIMVPRFNLHNTDRKLYFFVMGSDETENLERTLCLAEKYHAREHTELFVLSSVRESELVLNKIPKGTITIRRINEVQSLIYHTFYKNGDKEQKKDDENQENGDEKQKTEKGKKETNERIFSKEYEDPPGVKQIHAVILGLGQYGTEMLKALVWYCQVDGYYLTIDAFDQRQDAESELRAACPELLSPEFNGKYNEYDSNYTIRIHSGADAETFEVQEKIQKLEHVTYAFVALGSDMENVRMSIQLRSLWKKAGLEPPIRTVVQSAGISSYIQNAKDYNIDYIGNIRETYTENVILPTELEQDALNYHLRFTNDEQTFWNYEYNYRSSVAHVIAQKARQVSKGPGTKPEAPLTDQQLEALRCLEQRRWNAYMRSEGYIYGEKRDDIAKMHDRLKAYNLLTDEQKNEIQP